MTHAKLYRLTAALVLPLSLFATTGCAQAEKKDTAEPESYPVQKSEDQWRALLSPEQFHILREKGTERAFTGKFNDFKEEGTFVCAGCALPLFKSDTKYDSRSGWPSFYDIVSSENVAEVPDRSHGWTRTEVVCAQCGGHLGHVFEDGPRPTGLRYCINSAAMDFVRADE